MTRPALLSLAVVCLLGLAGCASGTATATGTASPGSGSDRAAASPTPTSDPAADARLVAQRKADRAAVEAEASAAPFGGLPCPRAGQPVRPAVVLYLGDGEPCIGADEVVTGPKLAGCDDASTFVRVPEAAPGVEVVASVKDKTWREVTTEQAQAEAEAIGCAT